MVGWLCLHLLLADRPNILLIVSDDQRPDTIAARGNDQLQTPTLDRWVRQGVWFERAACSYPLCVPSRAEMLTGLTSFRNGFAVTGKLDMNLKTYPQALQEAGYHTGFVGKWHTTGKPSQRGFARTMGLFGSGGGQLGPLLPDFRGRPATGYTGWVLHADDGSVDERFGVGLTPTTSVHLADAASRWLRSRPADQPFFLQINFTAPHDPRHWPPGVKPKLPVDSIPLPPNFLPEHPFDHGNIKGRDEVLLPFPRTPEDVRLELAAYYAVITQMDEQIGRLEQTLQELKLDANTIIVFTSDHGLAIGSHGLVGKQNMYDHTIRVPLVMKGPSVPAGRTIAGLATLRDLFPTFCDWAQMPTPTGLDAKSLLPLLSGQAERVHDHHFGYFQNSQRMVQTERYKYVRYPQAQREQLFDLQADPHERTNRSADPALASIKKELVQRLDQWQRDQKDPAIQ